MRHCQEALISDSLFAVDRHNPLGEVLRRGRGNHHSPFFRWRRAKTLRGFLFRFSASFHLSDILIYHAKMFAVLTADKPFAGTFSEILVDVVFLCRITGRGDTILMGSRT